LRVSDHIGDVAALAGHLVEAVREAGALALKTFDGPLQRWTKADGSPVTDGDIAVDRLLHRHLAGAVPDAAWLSEERPDDSARLSARRAWVIDPIDGTRAYMGGRPDWSIAVALVEDGRPILSAVFAPVEQALFLAAAGEGATLNGAPISAGSAAELEGARFAGPKRQLDRLARLIPGLVEVPRVYSLALRLARIAEGALDVAFASGPSHDWDLAAADLLVHEAGGALTTLDGRVLSYNGAILVHGALIAAGRARHTRLLALLQDRQAEFE
jgi:myo-inositol-1(or 4)-monophosphatase